jgi:hypothetical protein
MVTAHEKWQKSEVKTGQDSKDLLSEFGF